MQMYPKCLYGKQGLDNINDVEIVFDATEEAAAKKDGYREFELVVPGSKAEENAKPAK